jgi:hypothetical protein
VQSNRFKPHAKPLALSDKSIKKISI